MTRADELRALAFHQTPESDPNRPHAVKEEGMSDGMEFAVTRRLRVARSALAEVNQMSKMRALSWEQARILDAIKDFSSFIEVSHEHQERRDGAQPDQDAAA